MLLPSFDPVAFAIGPLVIRWYALAYIGGLIIGWLYARFLAKRADYWGGARSPQPIDIDDLIVYAAFGVVAGGRLGFVLFYQPGYYLSHPLEIFQVWLGGMSFHGGLVGAAVGVMILARQRGIDPLRFLDLAAVVAPIGLLLGRIANFVNGELWGRPSDVPWAVIFPRAGQEPRHPSQLYEAFFEGAVLVVLLGILVRWFGFRRPGLLAGVFAGGYALARIGVEFFREPDRHLGFMLGGWVTMGMLLSMPMLIIGMVLVRKALK